MKGKLIIAAFDGIRVCFFDASQVDEDTLSRLEPHLNEVEAAYLDASRKLGYDAQSQFAHAVCASPSLRTNTLLDLVISGKEST